MTARAGVDRFPRMSAHEFSHKVGTKILFENDRVRVWEMILQPGEASTYHEHLNDYLFVYMSHSKLEVLQKDKRPEISEQGPGFVQYRDVGSGIDHQVKNVGDTTHREILVELKGPSRTSKPQPPVTNA